MASIALLAMAPLVVETLGVSLAVAQIGLGVAGYFIDRALFGSSGQSGTPQEGPRLSDLKVTSSTEGAPLQRLYGRARMSGQVIWATNLEEVQTQESTGGGGGGGGKGGGGGGGGGGSSSTYTKYTYFANFAIGICEGEVSSIGRVWADGKEINLADYTYRFYKGDLTQMPDSLMEAKEGSGNVPGYRGLAYVVFERMPLEHFGNRIPNMNFEIFRAVDSFEKGVKAITILPGSGEFVYSTQAIERDIGANMFNISQPNRISQWVNENTNTRRGAVNWTIAMNDMQSSFVNLKNGALIVSWFGTDLRCDQCQLVPKVENAEKYTRPLSWSVAGYTRLTAPIVSQYNGTSAFGGTPDDTTVVQAITDLKARGVGVTFYPFIMMDVPHGNTLPDPYSASGTSQAVYPWRGRITLSKAPGIAGTPDQTAAAATEVATFVAQYRNFILHYANLCASAGGVDAFYIATELRGLTTIRDSRTHYPFVDAMVQLAADVKAILPGAKITYGADWSEYFGHQPGDGSGDAIFHLDPFWSSPNVSAIAIDCYWPLADWRSAGVHADRAAGFKTIYEARYLKGNVQGGEGYDWYYASQANRDAQIRTPITDGLGKPWVFRYKDIKSWWRNTHYNRVGGVEVGATAWVPESKEFWFSEVGCPAIDKGANQPNVFYDPKSSESFFPYYSSGVRDDFMQRRFVQCFQEFWDTTHADYIADSNPTSSVYGGPMVNVERIYVYTWDARPYPAFPYAVEGGWADRENWPYGHWLTGRVGGGSLDSVVRAICNDYGWTKFDVAGLSGQVDGYLLDRIMSIRDAINPLELAYFFDSFESEGIIKFRHRGYLGSQITVDRNHMVDGDGLSGTSGGGRGGGQDSTGTLFEITRAQETDLPLAAKLTYSDGTTDYRNATVEARRLTVRSERISSAQLAIVSRQAQMQSIADILLHENWVTREKGRVVVPPSMLFLEPTDLIKVDSYGRTYNFRITGIQDGGKRSLDLMQIDPSIYNHVRGADRTSNQPPSINYAAPTTFFMDLPMLRDTNNENCGYVASYLEPWPGAIAVLRSPVNSGFNINTILTGSCILGTTAFDFYNGPLGRWDMANQLIVDIASGILTSMSDLEVFAGNNTCAIYNQAADVWEIVQFADATLLSTKRYKLTKLLRGQLGSERAMAAPLPAGSKFCMLNSNVVQNSMSRSDIYQTFWWKDGPSSRSIADTSYNTRQYAFRGEGLRAYSPTNLKLIRQGSNLVITWKRRTRIGGDNWALLEAPLSEEYERYKIIIYNSGTPVRTVETSEPQYVYVFADYMSDFGYMPNDVEVSIWQSTTYGLGSERRQFLNLSVAAA